MSGINSLIPKRKLKLEDVIDITDNNGLVTIDIKRDMLLKIDGNLLSLVNGLSVTIAKEIHLNPDIPKTMAGLKDNIEVYKQIQLNKQSKQSNQLTNDCNCKGKKR